MQRQLRKVPGGPEPQWFTSTLRSLGTYSEATRRLHMARYVGTGKAPEGQYVKDQVVDLPSLPDGSIDPAYQDIVDKGWVRELADKDDPARTKTQIANAMVRGDALSHPAEAKIAKDIGEDAMAIVHTQDPGASHGDELVEAKDPTPPSTGAVKPTAEGGGPAEVKK